MTTVSPRPGRKKSMNFRLPGRTIRVLVPLPTGVRNGEDAATQMAMATAVVFMPNACTMGMNNGVTSMAQEVFIMALVSRVTRTRMINSTSNLLGCSPSRFTAVSAIRAPAPLLLMPVETALMPATINRVDRSMDL